MTASGQVRARYRGVSPAAGQGLELVSRPQGPYTLKSQPAPDQPEKRAAPSDAADFRGYIIRAIASACLMTSLTASA